MKSPDFLVWAGVFILLALHSLVVKAILTF